MAIYGLWEVPLGMLVYSKFVATMPGAVFVIITLDTMMPKLRADSLASQIEVS